MTTPCTASERLESKAPVDMYEWTTVVSERTVAGNPATLALGRRSDLAEGKSGNGLRRAFRCVGEDECSRERSVCPGWH